MKGVAEDNTARGRGHRAHDYDDRFAVLVADVYASATRSHPTCASRSGAGARLFNYARDKLLGRRGRHTHKLRRQGYLHLFVVRVRESSGLVDRTNGIDFVVGISTQYDGDILSEVQYGNSTAFHDVYWRNGGTIFP